MNRSRIRSVARFLPVSLIAAAGIAVIIGSGGGGGGGDVDVTPPSTVLNYILSGPRGPGSLSVSAMGGALAITFPSNPPVKDLPWLEGTFDTATENFVLDSSPDPVAWADTTGAPFGKLEARVTQAFRWNNGSDPAVGAFAVTSRDQPATFTGTITATVTAGAPAGVTISWDSDNNGTPDFGPVSYSWDQFEDLWEDRNKELWERVASFTYSMREFLFEQADLAIEAFTVIEDLFAAFESAGPGTMQTTACSTGSPVGGPNEVRVTWNDNDGSGTISNEDSFAFVFDDCWIDDPGNDIDTVLNGQLDFLHYDRHVQACPTYSNLRFDETNGGGLIPGSDLILNGGLCLFIPGI